MPWLLLVSLLLLILNGLFVLIEFALVKVRHSRMEVLARKGSSRALKVQDIQGHLDQYLAAIQFGITIVSLALGWIGEPAIAGVVKDVFERTGLPIRPELLHGVSYGVALALLAWMHIVFGELIPRSVGIQKADVVSMWGAYPLQIFTAIFRYPVALMSWCAVGVLHLAGLKSVTESDAAGISEEEMRVMLGETQEKGSFPLERLLLLENLFDIGSAKVSEAMIPRERIAFLSLTKTLEENLEVVRAKRYSRYPLCERDDLDSVVGMVHVKDLVLKADAAGLASDLRRVRREVAETVETEPLEKLLKAFPDKGIQMALVRNGLGRIVGLLTLEDIIEELIGEVHDEFDLPQAWSLAELVVPAAVVVQSHHSLDRRGAIALLVSKLAAAHPALKEAEALQVVWDRELKFSSAVGRGVAVPHGRLAGLERPLVALGKFSPPLPFPAPDGMPVRLVFLILTPAASPVAQLKVLGRIASLVTNENLRRKLLRAKTAESTLDILRTADTMLAA